MSLGVALLVAAALAAPAAARPTAVLAFLDAPDAFGVLRARQELALGFVNATQGRYTRRQALLDVSAGNRVSPSGYDRRSVPAYAVRGGRVTRWGAVTERARSAPTDIVPGTLGALGEAAFAGRAGALEGVVAADRGGVVRRADAGAPGGDVRTLVTVVRGGAALDRLLRGRPADRLVLVVARPRVADSPQDLAAGAAGLGEGLLTSRTTRRRGYVAATDLTATVLDWLGVPLPAAVRGRPITAAGVRDADALRRAHDRLVAAYPRRRPAGLAVLAAVAVAAAALVLAGRRRAAARISALAALWIPLLTLLTGALKPSEAVELAIMGIGTVALGALTDRLVPWPRAPAVPALAAVIAYALDLVLGSQLIVGSLLGPNPRFGSRFYGIGNELEATLPVLLLVGLAAAVGYAPRSRALACAFAAAMLALGVVVGAGRLGADVGGVVTIGAAAATAVVLLLPGGVSRRRLALAVATPVAAVLLLAAIDLATGGDAHFSTTVLGAEDTGAVLETLGRRYELAWDALGRNLMPLEATVAAALAVAGVWRRRTLYAPVERAPAWRAALAGGLAAAVAGALANDSGPLLLVVGVFMLAVATLYVRGRPDRNSA